MFDCYHTLLVQYLYEVFEKRKKSFSVFLSSHTRIQQTKARIRNLFWQTIIEISIAFIGYVRDVVKIFQLKIVKSKILGVSNKTQIYDFLKMFTPKSKFVYVQVQVCLCSMFMHMIIQIWRTFLSTIQLYKSCHNDLTSIQVMLQ